ncbi:endonuclease domain-containing protein [Streptomyces sp. NPDC048521]|uniref:endonuclease domain-containing protein n=1 Tax=Streptomyces sp. NPDC048521 TaxID=3365566 RepID=UPI0037118890
MSHGSAAALWRIELLGGNREAPLDFIDPHLSIHRLGSGVRVHRMPLGRSDVAERQGLRLTIPTRTLADLLRRGPRDEAVVAVDSALTYRRVGRVRRAPLVRRDEIAAALETASHGSAQARNWLRLTDPLAGSPAETVARLRMYDAGLRPESQAELRTPDGSRRIVDFLFRAAGLGVEIEGYAYHGTREAHRRDIARYNQLLRCPEIRGLLRFTAEDVFRRPAYMVAEIRATLASLTGDST